MPDKKLTDSEIVKALECLVKGKCPECPYFISYPCGECRKMLNSVLDLINRLQVRVEKLEKVEHFADKTIATLQAENERLKEGLPISASFIFEKAQLDELLTRTVEVESKFKNKIKAEAYKEFAERVKLEFYYEFDELIPSIMADKIDNLLKELAGEENG